jgi:aryl-alcohol dehydrogenase-like predicted oxidoreductase
MNELQNLRQEGVIKNIGISVQSPLELENALDCNEVSIIQMPFNILDYRWDKLIPKIVKEKEGRSLLIHARSSLLQGLLQSSDEKMWNCSGISNYKKIISWLNNTYKEHYKISVTDLCIGYVNSQPWVDSVVIGVDSLSHLYSNLQSISMPLINDHNLNIIKNNKPYISESGLNPSEWKANI